jgi:hypothetical protein
MSDELQINNPLPEEQAPEPVASPDPAAEPEPEGVVEVAGQKMVPVGVLTAERRRLKEAHERDLVPVRERLSRADQIEARLNAFEQQQRQQPQPEPAKDDPIAKVTDEDAERLAKRYELFTPTGLDLPRAKQIIAEQRAETRRIAEEAASQAMAPLLQDTAATASKHNFVEMATQKAPDGSPLLDANDQRALAELWAGFPPELTANPAVAQVILNAALGQRVRSRKPQPSAPGREPLVTESAGGVRPAYTASNVEKKMAQSVGMSASDWEKAAKTYQPGIPNALE